MIARYTASCTTATAVTIGLLLAMSHLIATGPGLELEPPRIPFTAFTVEKAPPPDVLRRERVEPTTVDPRPPQPRTVTDAGGSSLSIRMENPNPPAVERQGPLASGPSDGDLLPIVKVQPSYPPAALTRNLEGYVIVEYTVTRSGTVENVIVVESSDHVFHRAAIAAAERFRYRPRIVNGEAIRVTNVRNLFRFELEGARRR